MDKLNVLLLGGGGREHAIAWKLSQSSLLNNLFISPGNPGTEQHGTHIELDIGDFDTLYDVIQSRNIDLVVVGPEKPLVDGLGDYLAEQDVAVFGPSKAAAQLEGSKSFAKEFMEKNGIPTAGYKTFSIDRFDEAEAYIINQNQYPVVLKADGLAGGKGVFICESEEEVKDGLDQLSKDDTLKKAASTLVVEEFMEGEEASVFVISDGKTGKVIHNAQDHKRIGEGDTGLNTGGMGAYAPAPLLNENLLDQIDREITRPTIDGMREAGMPYQGILYLGLMITETGPKVVEYNCRFGDPECQVILPALKNDLLELMLEATEQNLAQTNITIDNLYYCTVVLASGGYPEKYEKGFQITGVDDIDKDAIVFMAGTSLKNGDLVTDGGRVLNVVGKGETLEQSIQHAYKNAEKISFKNCYYRKDIGKKGLRKLA